MSDLVERLLGWSGCADDRALMREAADKIERLTEDLDRVTKGTWLKEIARLTAEVVRLKEQLRLANVDAFQNEAEANGMRPVVEAAREVLADHDEREATFPGQSRWHLNKLRVMGMLRDALRALDGEL